MSGVLTASQEAAVPQTERVQTPSFGTVTVYPPLAAPEEVVLFLSGDGGWNLGVVDMAERLRDAGALVVGIDIRAFLKRLDVPGRCVYPAGALEELSRAVQLRFKLPAYVRPMLAGYELLSLAASSGALETSFVQMAPSGKLARAAGLGAAGAALPHAAAAAMKASTPATRLMPAP